MGFREPLDTRPEAKRAECTAQSAGIGIGIAAVLAEPVRGHLGSRTIDSLQLLTAQFLAPR